MALERMVYRSTATGATSSLLNLSTILAESQRNNDRDDLTGALAAHDNRYIQVVEGPAAALDRLISRLADDPRHRDVEMIDREPVARRLFGDWRMASARITPALAPALDAMMAEARPSAAQLIETLARALAPGEAATA